MRAGLRADEVAARLRADGPNVLPVPRRPGPLRRLGRQLVHFFAIMLWAAGTLAFLAGLPQLGVAIFAIVVRAVFARGGSVGPSSPMKVRPSRRRRTCLSADVVREDVLLLGEGDRVPADATLVASDGLRVDTSMLTGESRAQGFDVGELVVGGTFVVEGQAEAEVTATGSRTRLPRSRGDGVGRPRPVRSPSSCAGWSGSSASSR